METIEQFLFFASALLMVLSYWLYFKGIRGSNIRPNIWSWIIWSFSMIIEALTYDALSNDDLTSAVFYISTIACVVITIAIWHKGEWKTPNRYEFATLALSFSAIAVWYIWQSAEWANYIAVIALPVAFIPTYKDAWKDYRHEDTPSWKLWTIADLCVIIMVFIGIEKIAELPYAVVEAISHSAVWIIVVRGKRLAAAN